MVKKSQRHGRTNRVYARLGRATDRTAHRRICGPTECLGIFRGNAMHILRSRSGQS